VVRARYERVPAREKPADAHLAGTNLNPTPQNLLFVCSQNKLRSPTAEHVFSQYPGKQTLSAGTNNDAVTPLDAEMIEWADIVFVMEKSHLTKVRAKFRSILNGKRVICLNIPDDYAFMDPDLVRLLEAKIPRFL
jgi:predicted protein tyrosine phosphatase